MYLENGNETPRESYCLILSQGLSSHYGRCIKHYRVQGIITKLQAKNPMKTSVLSLRTENQETCLLGLSLPLAHYVFFDKSQLFSNLEDNQNLGKHPTYIFPNGIWLSRFGWSPGISILIFSRRFFGLLTSTNHPSHSFLLCKILLAWVAQQIC